LRRLCGLYHSDQPGSALAAKCLFALPKVPIRVALCGEIGE